MIYTVGRKPTSHLEESSAELPELPVGTRYAVADGPSQFLSSSTQSASSADSYTEKLAARIVERIESRIPCRIRKLRVYASSNAVILEGRCSTYYTKQIAQHTAMGVLEYERLINNIAVLPGK